MDTLYGKLERIVDLDLPVVVGIELKGIVDLDLQVAFGFDI